MVDVFMLALSLVVPKSVFTAADTAVAIEGRCVTWGKREVVMVLLPPVCIVITRCQYAIGDDKQVVS